MARIAVVGAGAWGTALAVVAARAGHARHALGSRSECGRRDGAGTRECASVAGNRVTARGAPDGGDRRGRRGGVHHSGRAGAGASSRAWNAAARCGTVRDRGQGPGAGERAAPERGRRERAPAVPRGSPVRPVLRARGGARAADGGHDRQRATSWCRASLAELMAGPAFRPYPSDDLPGVELAGALKNVVAIAAGVTMGKGLGENARAALITRGLAEMTRTRAGPGRAARDARWASPGWAT